MRAIKAPSDILIVIWLAIAPACGASNGQIVGWGIGSIIGTDQGPGLQGISAGQFHNLGVQRDGSIVARIDLKPGRAPAVPTGPIAALGAAPPSGRLPEIAKDPARSWWLQTDFHPPFMYTIGAEPFFDEHAFLALPFIRRGSVREVRTWINGSTLEVRNFAYPSNRGLGCYYADLVGAGARGGQNRLVVYVEYGG